MNIAYRYPLVAGVLFVTFEWYCISYWLSHYLVKESLERDIIYSCMNLVGIPVVIVVGGMFGFLIHGQARARGIK